MNQRFGILLFCLFFVFDLSAQVKILPLGNSITQGNYRYDLWKMLIDAGLEFEFVGSVNSSPTSGGAVNSWPPYQGHNFDDSHEGHPGWKTEHILNGVPWNPGLGNIQSWLWGYTPDMVLLHIGTNDVPHDEATVSVENILQILQILQADNPQVAIFLAKIIPRAGYEEAVLALNQQIDLVAQNASTMNSCVQVVDHYEGFHVYADTYDGTHPNRSGDIKMAEKWTTAIVNHLNEEGQASCGAAFNCGSLEIELVVQSNISCFGGSDGAVQLQIEGGTAPYQIQWSNNETSSFLDGLNAGEYAVTLSDANGCEIVNFIKFSNPPQLQINIFSTNESFIGGNDGSASVDANGGTPPYTFEWNTGSTSSSIEGLEPAEYTVTVEDALGCSRVASVVVSPPDCSFFQVELLAVDATCFGESNGSINAIPNGGIWPYIFQWSNGVGEATQNDLEAGVYTLTVTDAQLCEIETTIKVNEPPALEIDIDGNHVNYVNASNGQASALALGGSPPYFYQWSNGGMTPTIENLVADWYEVTVIDANNCLQTAAILIEEPDCSEFTLDAETEDTHCNENNGWITVAAHGGQTPYQFQWNNDSLGLELSNLSPGFYELTATDNVGCVLYHSIEILPSEEMQLNILKTDVSCWNSEDGSIELEVVKGTPPYRFEWNNGADSQNLSQLSPATYAVEVKDFYDCSVSALINIDAPEPLEVEIYAEPALDGENGSAVIIVDGGTPDYAIQWSHGAIGDSLTHLNAGMYEVTITDSRFCEIRAEVTIETVSAFGQPISSPSIDVFPNPTNDVFSIKTTTLFSSLLALKIYNSKGQIMENQRFKKGKRQQFIDVKDWESGVYQMVIETDKGVEVKTIVVF